MTEDLLAAVNRLHVEGHELCGDDESIDRFLNEQRPRQQSRQPGKLREELEETFLHPSTVFSPEWLNRLQE